MTRVSPTSGKRVGSRRAARKRSWPTRKTLLLTLAVTLCVVAWGYLVLAAIDFGATARSGESGAWLFLGLACLGATACLFAGLMLGARLLRSLGIIADPVEPEPQPEPAADSLAGLASAGTLTVSPVVEEKSAATATAPGTTTTLPAVEPTPPLATSHASETLRPAEATEAAEADQTTWRLAPRPDPLNDPLEGPLADLPPAGPTPSATQRREEGTPEVPAPRQGERPRGKRIADKPLHPDGPRPTGGRRIAR